MRHKQSYDWPLVQAAVAFKLDGGKASEVQIVLGHVAPTPHVAADGRPGAGRQGGDRSDGQPPPAEAAAEGSQAAQPERLQGQAGRGGRQARLLTAAGQKKYWEA